MTLPPIPDCPAGLQSQQLSYLVEVVRTFALDTAQRLAVIGVRLERIEEQLGDVRHQSVAREQAPTDPYVLGDFHMEIMTTFQTGVFPASVLPGVECLETTLKEGGVIPTSKGSHAVSFLNNQI